MENYYELTKDRNEAIINEPILEADNVNEEMSDLLKLWHIQVSIW